MGSRWIFGARALEGIPVDRARERYTLVYRVLPNLQVGVEWNPQDDDFGGLLNWRILDETAQRPALILGTSSDRIGTSNGRAYYLTASKNLEIETGLPIAPYVGVAFGEQDDEWVGIGGMQIRYDEHWASTHFWDSQNLHHVLTRRLPYDQTVGLVVARQSSSHYVGLTYSIAFDG